MQLLEEATEGCWIGHRARMFTSEIGSVYSPPKQDKSAVMSPQPSKFVETVIDVGHVDTVRSVLNRACTLSLFIWYSHTGLDCQMRERRNSSYIHEPVREQSKVYFGTLSITLWSIVAQSRSFRMGSFISCFASTLMDPTR